MDEEKELTSNLVETPEEGQVEEPEKQEEPETSAPVEDKPEEEQPEETAEKPEAKKQPKLLTEEETSKIIEARLARDRRVREKELSSAAGIKMTFDEAKKAARLWGMLAQNPDLTEKVRQVLDEHLSRSPMQPTPSIDLKEQELALKEAVIDLRLKDPVFREHESDIMTWAELNGIEIEDPKTLRLAYLGWKGENAAKLAAEVEVKAKESVKAKATEKSNAKLIPGKGARATGKPLDYKGMSAEDILRAEGLKLWTSE